MKDWFEQCSSSITFKYFNNLSTSYVNHVFKSVSKHTINTRTSFLKLNQPLRKTSHEQTTLSYVASTNWNNKKTENFNKYKHKVKKHFLCKMSDKGNNIYYCF